MNVTYISTKEKNLQHPGLKQQSHFYTENFFAQTFLVTAAVTFKPCFHQQREHEQRQNAQAK